MPLFIQATDTNGHCSFFSSPHLPSLSPSLSMPISLAAVSRATTAMMMTQKPILMGAAAEKRKKCKLRNDAKATISWDSFSLLFLSLSLRGINRGFGLRSLECY